MKYFIIILISIFAFSSCTTCYECKYQNKYGGITYDRTRCLEKKEMQQWIKSVCDTASAGSVCGCMETSH